eukprot:m.192421 g.192421  ORF g.192421 m.192421 type:complete len:291 (+) comp24949_c0_seq3:1380-2252(+)
MSTVGVAAGVSALGLWWLARQTHSESRAIANAPTVRGGDLSASVIRGTPPLPRGLVHVTGTVTGPGGSGPLEPENTAVLFVMTRLQKVFDCAQPTQCNIRWDPVWENVEALGLFELQQDFQLNHKSTAVAGQALSDPVLKQIVNGGSIGPYRGVSIKERVQVDGTVLTSLDHVVDADNALQVDTRTFTPAADTTLDDKTIADYIATTVESGTVDHIPPQHRTITLGELYLERSLNLGDTVGHTRRPQPFVLRTPCVFPALHRTSENAHSVGTKLTFAVRNAASRCWTRPS